MKKIICFATHYLSQSVQETIDSVMVILDSLHYLGNVKLVDINEESVHGSLLTSSLPSSAFLYLLSFLSFFFCFLFLIFLNLISLKLTALRITTETHPHRHTHTFLKRCMYEFMFVHVCASRIIFFYLTPIGDIFSPSIFMSSVSVHRYVFVHACVEGSPQAVLVSCDICSDTKNALHTSHTN